MELMTEKLKKKFADYPIYSQDGAGIDARLVVKYFLPGSGATWLITEGGELDDGDWEFFGYVTLDGQEWEWGYVLLSQLRELRDPAFRRLSVEIDLSAGDFVKDELPVGMRKTE